MELNSMQWLIAWIELPYGPYHSPALGDRVTTTVDVISAAANGELGFDDVTVQTAPSPKPAERSQYPVLFFSFYRAMHVMLARYCYRKSSVRPSVRDVDVSWAYTLD